MSIATSRAALGAPGIPLEERILQAFESMARDTLVSRLDEVLETAERLAGRPATELEGAIIAEFATALDGTADSSPWRRNGDSAEPVATITHDTPTTTIDGAGRRVGLRMGILRFIGVILFAVASIPILLDPVGDWQMQLLQKRGRLSDRMGRHRRRHLAHLLARQISASIGRAPSPFETEGATAPAA